MRLTEPFSQIFSTPVDPANGFRRVAIELTVPSLPVRAGTADFAEHVLDGDGLPTHSVVACSKGAVIVSDDLGENWEHLPIPELSEIDLWNSFTMSSGKHLLQGRGAASLGTPRTDEDLDAPIAVLNSDWELEDRATPGVATWHGSRSIDEANGAIIYAEYPANSHRPGPFRRQIDSEQREFLHDSQIFRSVDGGHSWNSVLRVDWATIRHFHTVAADPWRQGRWWASSGDRPDECRVWQSLDNGSSWSEIESELPVDELSPAVGNARGTLRYTDLAISEHDLIWGADDWLGAMWPRDVELPLKKRGGSRLFRSPKEPPWKPESLGYVGNPIRSLIDVGPAYIFITEAKTAQLGYRPQVTLLSKSTPFLVTPLVELDNFATSPATGFTHSRASRVAKDGVFFTYRRSTDAFPDGPSILRWRVTFD